LSAIFRPFSTIFPIKTQLLPGVISQLKTLIAQKQAAIAPVPAARAQAMLLTGTGCVRQWFLAVVVGTIRCGSVRGGEWWLFEHLGVDIERVTA
jgi:hypothetical protein